MQPGDAVIIILSQQIWQYGRNWQQLALVQKLVGQNYLTVTSQFINKEIKPLITLDLSGILILLRCIEALAFGRTENDVIDYRALASVQIYPISQVTKNSRWESKHNS